MIARAFHSSIIFNCFLIFFFFNDTATTEIYTLSLHDALPISPFSEPALFARASSWVPPLRSSECYKTLLAARSTLRQGNGWVPTESFCTRADVGCGAAVGSSAV